MAKERITIDSVTMNAALDRAAGMGFSLSMESLHNALGIFIEEELKQKDKSGDVIQCYPSEKSLPAKITFRRARNNDGSFTFSRSRNIKIRELIYLFIGKSVDALETINFNPTEQGDFIEESQTKQNDSQVVNANKSLDAISCIRLGKLKQYTQEKWKALETDSKTKLNKISARYYTYLDPYYIEPAIANNLLVKLDELFEVQEEHTTKEIRTLGQILDLAASQDLALIKVLAEGGLGKSTFLKLIAYKYCDTYNIFQVLIIDSNFLSDITEICTYYNNDTTKPLIFLIDSIATTEDAIELSKDIIRLRHINLEKQLIFIIADRINRYHDNLGKKFDQNLSGNIQTILYKPPSYLDVFTKVYGSLKEDNRILRKREYEKLYQKQFLESSITSISERTLELLDHLKIKHEINYVFDWEDWNEFIENNAEKFADLSYLFLMIASFYQFGIKLSINFKSKHLGRATNLTIADAIESHGFKDKSIITLDDRGFLSLKHELIASWYLRRESKLARIFFEDFLNNVSDTIQAKLFRKIRKVFKSTNTEFSESIFSDLFSWDKCLKIVDAYLVLPNLNSLENEKMLTEKGIILKNLNRVEEAVEIFWFVADNYPKNNHSRDQLAKYYTYDNPSLQLAFQLYIEILHNEGFYAFSRINKILDISKRRNIIIAYRDIDSIMPENIYLILDEFNDVDKCEIIKLLIQRMELRLSKSCLKYLDTYPNQAAECYLLLAKYRAYSNDKIILKNDEYNEAIKIYLNNQATNELANAYVQYAEFLFRICEFKDSNEFFSKALYLIPDEEKEYFKVVYNRKILSLKRLFFRLPDINDSEKYELFIERERKKAYDIINNPCAKNHIHRAYLILQTVRFHTRQYLPKIYLGSTISLAKLYLKQSQFLNNLSDEDNLVYAEHLFYTLIGDNFKLDNSAVITFIQILLAFEEEKRAHKVIDLCKNAINKKEPKYLSNFYKYRGYAKILIKDYLGAITDFTLALNKCNPSFFEKFSDYTNVRYGIVLAFCNHLCTCLENKLPMHGYTKADTLQKFDELVRMKKNNLNSDLVFLEKRLKQLG